MPLAPVTDAFLHTLPHSRAAGTVTQRTRQVATAACHHGNCVLTLAHLMGGGVKSGDSVLPMMRTSQVLPNQRENHWDFVIQVTVRIEWPVKTNVNHTTTTTTSHYQLFEFIFWFEKTRSNSALSYDRCPSDSCVTTSYAYKFLCKGGAPIWEKASPLTASANQQVSVSVT